jgi:endonuclease/exonuclease/phosphatase family metal-dependent hydrolase
MREAKALRVITYNIHSCLGTDGRRLPERIAQAIASLDPDIVALQEVDVNRARSSQLDQAHQIAYFLNMAYFFHPSFQVAEEQYGNAILSRLPMQLVKAGPLPRRGSLEPRGVLWVEVSWRDLKLQVFNTHFGLSPAERRAQLKAILGPDWLSHSVCTGPVILCGDLNTPPRSLLCQSFRARLNDAAAVSRHRHLRGTFPSRLPLVRLDHIFVSPEIQVIRAEVAISPLLKVASDHLPFLAELSI